MESPAALRSSFSLIIRTTPICCDGAQGDRKSAKSNGYPQEPIKGIIADSVDNVCKCQKIDTEVLRNVLEKSFYHVEIVPFLGYNRGSPSGRFPSPLALG